MLNCCSHHRGQPFGLVERGNDDCQVDGARFRQRLERKRLVGRFEASVFLLRVARDDGRRRPENECSVCLPVIRSVFAQVVSE